MILAFLMTSVLGLVVTAAMAVAWQSWAILFLAPFVSSGFTLVFAAMIASSMSANGGVRARSVIAERHAE